MTVEKLTNSKIPQFKEYFGKYSHEQDESNPPLDDFLINDNEPAYLLTKGNEIIGAASLMIYPEYREVKHARFRIFHSKEPLKANYTILLNKILEHTRGLKSVYCFIEDKFSAVWNIWEELGFTARRFAWILERETTTYTMSEFPKGFELKTFRDGIDENNWCAIINEAFEHILGHVRMTPQKIEHWRLDTAYIAGGMKLLWHNDKPVGILAMIKENHNNEDTIFIEAIGILNDYRGKGLGKNLLRAGIEYAANFGSTKVMLSVNAENDNAAELYFREGFTKEALYKCYYYDVQ